jgi:hypothetical protein
MRSSAPASRPRFRGLCRLAGAGLFIAALAAVPLSAPPAGAALVRPDALNPGTAAKGAVPLGGVQATQELTVSMVLPPANQAALTSLLGNLYNPDSPQYHHWLAAGQFRAEFGPDPSDVATVTSWLRGYGLSPSASGYLVTVTAPESQLAGALGTGFERYSLPGGKTGYAATSTPLVPAELAAGQISSILGLNTTSAFVPQYTPDPSTSTGSAPQGAAPRADGLAPCSAATTEAGSQYDTLDQIGADYGIGSLLAAGLNGSHETIGLFELDQASATDIGTYKSCFNLTNSFSVANVDGGASGAGGGPGEADLDAEQAMTQAPGASVVSYQGPDTTQGAYDTWNSIVTADAAQVVTTSWAYCEPDAESTGEIGAYTGLFEQASSQGQSIFAASGDSGSEGCFSTDGTTSEEVTYPASDPWVTAVGGTEMYDNSPTDQTAWNWCGNDESTSCAQSIGGAGGGGMSRYEARPTYQPNILQWPSAQTCGTECREVPDISANAGTPMVIYTNGGWSEGGGTSFAAPLMGALVADVDSGCGRVGLLTPLLYTLYAEGSYGSAFDDVTTGNTDLTGSNGGAYAATSGYDAATGIGTPIAPGLTCASVGSVSTGYAGSTVTVSGLGLEHASINFGSEPADVVSANATTATVIVPPGSGTVTVSATGIEGASTHTASFTYGPPQHGYWLVGSDGGIFTFGSAQFYGSTGSLHLQRPVVGIVPTFDRNGYWLDASDGGVFAFGDAGFYGSIPGLGLHPAGSGLADSLNAPIVGMVPSSDGRGYFMVGADGGVFAFGDARFAGSCPGIGGCAGAAVAVAPDATGNGYWVVTQSGNVYAFGDAPYYGAPGPQSVPVTSAVRTPDGRGYWILYANGAISNFGDASYFGSPLGLMGGLDPATAIFTTGDGGGYWVAAANGAVANYGDAPDDGSMLGTRLNGAIIAATGW